MNAERIGEYLRASLLPLLPGRKTQRWEILSNDGDVLGRISWFGPWRQYTFDPAPRTTFNAACLADITSFLRRVNQARRATKESTS